jgi:hypothetical protein
MSEDPRIAELTHDISFAVFRVASLVEHNALRKELERAAVDLSSRIEKGTIGQLQRLIKLGYSIKEISAINTEVLTRELEGLGVLLGKTGDNPLEISASGLFGKERQKLPFRRDKTNGKNPDQNGTSSKRQTEILSFIRQFTGGCRMAELSNGFSGVSQRTLRNDISALINNGQVERVGSRGPYSYLRVIDTPGPRLEDRAPREKGEDEVIFLSGPQSGVFDTRG